MEFEDILAQTVALLQRQGRISYGALKRRFQLDDAYLEDLKIEIIEAQHLARDENGRILVWTGETAPTSVPAPVPQPAQTAPPPHTPADQAAQGEIRRVERLAPEAERRQLTVLFCDLADSTRLGRQLDPEDLREVIRAYQATCVEVIQRFAGYVAQYLGDGLLVYFGYPQAHEDDAQRAVRTGLGILESMGTLNTRLVQNLGVRLAVRIGIHTGLVVVGEMGSGGRHEHLALGDTPNLAARLQGLAAPDTVVLSDATSRLVQGYFIHQDLGTHALKGIDTPVRVYQAVGESTARSRLDVAGATGLTPLVGREAEVTLLQERWAQSTEGRGQVVLLRGEAGIGKSRLVHVLTTHVVDAGTPRLTFRCSPYHTNSALYPVIEHLQRLVQWHRDAPPEATLAALERIVQTTRLPLEEAVPLVATLLSLPVPERYPPLTLSPQRQKQKTQEVLVAWLLAETTPQPVLAVWEDLHWADPSTLELLGLVLDQVPMAHLLLVLTCRPEFRPPWPLRSSMTQLTLTHLTHHQVEEMILRVTGSKPFPAEVMQQIVVKTDGVPLFVEELVKAILDMGLVREEVGRYMLPGPLPPLAIPATLQDALMARLDRLAAAKQVAQLGATIGRTFAYDLIQAVASLDEATLQGALGQLVEAELVAQRGIPPQATYTFKHALIQDAAYQSLLRSTRQQYHQRIAQVMEAQFPDVAETQPELVAYHYTEAGVIAEAIAYWLRAGQHSTNRSAFVEASSHVRQGLALLPVLPDETMRLRYELDFQVTLGTAVMALEGHGSPKVESIYNRAWDLCQQIDGHPQLGRVLWGLWRFYNSNGVPQKSRQVAEQLLTLAEQHDDPALLLMAYQTLATSLVFLGDTVTAHVYCERGRQLSTAIIGQKLTTFLPYDPGIACGGFSSWTLWFSGYADQALERSVETLTLARELAHPGTLVAMLSVTGAVLWWCRQVSAIDARAQELAMLCDAQRFPIYAAHAMIWQGWVLCLQGHAEVGVAQMRQGLAALQTTSSRLVRPFFLAMLAEGCAMIGAIDEGLQALDEALHDVGIREERLCEAELYRLRGELLSLQSPDLRLQAEEAVLQALAVARRQQAKSLELRAAMSLGRLWQYQGKRAEAYDLLAGVYGWFTEGFDTADLQEAKALLEELGE